MAVLLLAWMTRVPWRTLFSPLPAFDGRRLAHCSLGAALLVGDGRRRRTRVHGLDQLRDHRHDDHLPHGEELMDRSVMLPAAASWVRAVRPALAVGLVVSALGFAAVHGSTDPWPAGYYLVVAVSTGLTAIISGGMEAPIAFHVVNNVLAGVVNDLTSGGGTSTVDRATDTGDASLLILVAVNIGMLVLVRTYERRRRTGEAVYRGSRS